MEARATPGQVHRTVPTLTRIGLTLSPAAVGSLAGVVATLWRADPTLLAQGRMIPWLAGWLAFGLGWGAYRLTCGARQLRVLAAGEDRWGKVERISLVFQDRWLAVYERWIEHGDSPSTVRVLSWGMWDAPRGDHEVLVVRDRRRPHVAVVPMCLPVPIYPDEGGRYRLFHGLGFELARFVVVGGASFLLAVWSSSSAP